MVKENYLESNINTLLGLYGKTQTDLARYLLKRDPKHRDLMSHTQRVYRMLNNPTYVTIDLLIQVADFFNLNLESLIRVNLREKVAEVLNPILKPKTKK